MKQIYLRSSTLSDLSTLLQFEQNLILAERPFNPSLKPEKIHYYNLPLMIQSPDTELIVAIDGEDIIGSGYARIETGKPFVQYDRFAYLGFMYILPEYRGKGVIQKIMDYLMDWSKSRGISEVQLDVYEENSRAVKAYEKVGFRKQLVKMRKKI